MIFHQLNQASNQSNSFLSKLGHGICQSLKDYLHRPSTVIDSSRSITIVEDYRKGFKPFCLVESKSAELPSPIVEEEVPKKQIFPTINFVKPFQHPRPPMKLNQPSYTFYQTQKFDLFGERGLSIQQSFMFEDLPSSVSLPTEQAKEATINESKNEQVIIDNPFLPKKNQIPCERISLQPPTLTDYHPLVIPQAKEKKDIKGSELFSNSSVRQSLFGPPENKREGAKNKKKKKQVRVD